MTADPNTPDIMPRDEVQKLLDDKSQGLFVPKDRFNSLARSLLAAHDEIDRLRADALAAQAPLVEQAVAALMNCGVDVPDGMTGDELSAFRGGVEAAARTAVTAIRALAHDTGVKALAELRAERDALNDECDRHCDAAQQADGLRYNAEAERDDLRARLADAEGRANRVSQIADEIDEQVKVTRAYVEDCGMDFNQRELMRICTSHFLDKARAIRAEAAALSPAGEAAT